MAEADIRTRRPLSPHLQVYKLIPTMVMSILHRLTGVALYFGTLIVLWWIVAAAAGQVYFEFVSNILTSWPGLLVLFGFSWALIHHMLGGIRHLVWDTGRFMGRETSIKLAWATLAGSIGLTLVLWMGLLLAG